MISNNYLNIDDKNRKNIRKYSIEILLNCLVIFSLLLIFFLSFYFISKPSIHKLNHIYSEFDDLINKFNEIYCILNNTCHTTVLKEMCLNCNL